ncbi:MAG: TonB-dependent receptor plug domain-containing protein [Bacteroidota bacterium]
MEKIKRIVGGLLVAFLMTACATTQPRSLAEQTNRQEDQRVIEVNNPITLSDLLVRAPGVTFDIYTGIPKVRGGYPLYVLDGIRLGRNYNRVVNSINVQEIKSVEVLRNVSETMIYGREGASGVILINTI